MLLENHECLYPPAFDAPIGGSPSQYYYNIWCAKTRMTWLHECENSFRLARFDTIPACDRRHSIAR